MTTAKQMIKKATKVYVGSPQANTWVKVTKAALNNALQGKELPTCAVKFTDDNKSILLVHLALVYGGNA
jgi:hypothetical protein|tara:strand:+ start:91 stop:297 length:207 start_codon:yes stop_codon:yes gene_type:complete